MQTRLADFIKNTPDGAEAEAILRRCVHCGFCNATCPTYQLLGDELDGPRGRIYLIKQMLEGQPATRKTQTHLDRCLSCRACETTCPSGVEYGRLAEVGRKLIHETTARSLPQRAMRWVLREALPRRRLFSAALTLGRMAKLFLPPSLGKKIPSRARAGRWPKSQHPRRMLALAGCVQPGLAPSINAATARVLDRLGISLIEAPRAGCCGAVRGHLDDLEAARMDARRNIDAWRPLIEQGVDAIVMTASGCGAFVRDYGHLLQHDADYAEMAARVSALTRDVSEIIAAHAAPLAALLPAGPPAGSVAFHAPCTLQHGQKIRGVVEGLLEHAGFTLTAVADGHLCCGSAGTYSILQPAIARTLRDNKLAALCAGKPAGIATANIGCLAHLQSGTSVPVRHWVELLDERLR